MQQLRGWFAKCIPPSSNCCTCISTCHSTLHRPLLCAPASGLAPLLPPSTVQSNKHQYPSLQAISWTRCSIQSSHIFTRVGKKGKAMITMLVCRDPHLPLLPHPCINWTLGPGQGCCSESQTGWHCRGPEGVLNHLSAIRLDFAAWSRQAVWYGL